MNQRIDLYNITHSTLAVAGLGIFILAGCVIGESATPAVIDATAKPIDTVTFPQVRETKGVSYNCR